MLIVTYDLVNNATIEDYQRVINGIKSSYPKAKRLTESCWLIHNPLNQNFVLSALSKFVKSTDRIMVAELKTFPTGKNLLEEVNPLVGLAPKLPRRPLGGL
jgi:cobalamin biosynthesis Co2+ chelatase CbiK